MKEQHLILENHGQTIKVPFSEVERIELSRLINPPRVTLFFKKTNGFGKKAVFATYVRYGLTFEFPEVDELKKRVQASRKS